MGWPQIVVIVILAYGFFIEAFNKFNDLNYSSGRVTSYIFALLVVDALFAYVLHCGGFW